MPVEPPLLIVPPRADPTREVTAAGWREAAAAGGRLLALGRASADRCLSRQRLLQEAEAGAAGRGAGRRLLLLKSAAELLDAPHPQTRLRAMGAGYSGLCDPASG